MTNYAENLAAAIARRNAIEETNGLTVKNRDFLARCWQKMQAPKLTAFLEAVKFDVDAIDGSNGKAMLAVYAVERLVKVAVYTEAGISEPQKPSDQYRYAHDLFASLRATVAKDKTASLSRNDLRATGSKGENKETATGYAEGVIADTVQVSGRIMATGTTAVQTRNTFAAFEALGMVAAVVEERGAFRFAAKPAAPMYRKMNKLFTDRIAASQ